MNELVEALEQTLSFLERSEDTVWSNLSVNETRNILEKMLCEIKNGRDFDKFELQIQFAPTGNIQEISLHNGWSQEYIKIAGTIDSFTG